MALLELAVVNQRGSVRVLVVGENIKAVVNLGRHRQRSASGEIEDIRLDDGGGRLLGIAERDIGDIETAAVFKREFLVLILLACVQGASIHRDVRTRRKDKIRG